jgi:putative transposase
VINAAIRPIGAILIEQSDDWATQRSRYITPETIGPLNDTVLPISLPAPAS